MRDGPFAEMSVHEFPDSGLPLTSVEETDIGRPRHAVAAFFAVSLLFWTAAAVWFGASLLEWWLA